MGFPAAYFFTKVFSKTDQPAGLKNINVSTFIQGNEDQLVPYFNKGASHGLHTLPKHQVNVDLNAIIRSWHK